MPRLINIATFAGADMEDAKRGLRLVIWNRGADGQRHSHELRGDEAEEAIIEIKDLLAHLSDTDDVPPTRRRRGKR